MIDTHCHLLPGLDDGPATDIDAIGLARHLAAQGVEKVLCTPHFSEQYPTRWTAANERFDQLRRELGTLDVGLEIELAAELSPTMALEAPAEQVIERTIGQRYVLVELVSATPAAAVDAITARLGSFGLSPVIAHPERCAAVQRRPQTLAAAVEAGAVVQVVAPSLTGQWGDSVWTTAWELVESGRAHLLGSDAHRAGRDGLEGAARLVRMRCGPAAVRRLTEQNPRLLIDGRACE